MKDLFVKNRNAMGERMINGDVMVLFTGEAPRSTADAHYNYMPNKNFYYFTGLIQENFTFAMTKINDKVEPILFIEKPNYDIEKWMGRKLRTEKAKELSGIENIKFVENFKSWLNGMIQTSKVERIFIDLEKQSWDADDSHAMMFAKEFANKYVHVQIKSIHKDVSELRVIKSDQEIEMIRNAVNLTKLGLENLMKNLKPGMFEYQAEALFDFGIHYNGAHENAFPTIAASGEDAVILHYVENDKQIPDDSLILMDLGAGYHNYASDITRTYPVSGKYTDRQKELYNIVLKAQVATIEAMKPGLGYAELNNTCKAVLIEECKKIGLIENDDEISKYYYHGVSHYMGLDVHDLGSRDAKLAPGMILTVEPGLYIAEEGIGIRIEDDILITENGHENLSKDIIKTVEDIEAFMAKA